MKHIIDLSYPITNGMMTYPSPNHAVVRVEQLARIEKQGRETRRLEMGSHSGTHVDAPRHFIEGGGGIESLPLDLLVGPATVLSFVPARDLWEITVEDLERLTDGLILRPRVILRFDWSRHFGDMTFYTRAPYFSVAAAEWLYAKGVRLFAMDIPSLDPIPPQVPGGAPDSPCHKLLLARGAVFAEYLCNLDQLRLSEVTLAVFPLCLVGSDGAPARILAWEESESAPGKST